MLLQSWIDKDFYWASIEVYLNSFFEVKTHLNMRLKRILRTKRNDKGSGNFEHTQEKQKRTCNCDKFVELGR